MSMGTKMSDAIQQQWHTLTQPSGETAVPDDTPLLIDLADRRVLEVSGSEARAFLQAILTQDILALDDHAATFSALCNAKGRALGLLRVVGHEGRFFLITRADIAESLQKRLQMYVLRRDVDLRPAERWVALGVMLPAPARCPFNDHVACEVIERLASQNGGDDSRAGRPTSTSKGDCSCARTSTACAGLPFWGNTTGWRR